MPAGDKYTINILRHVQNGYTISHLPDGKPVFVQGALPDETVECIILKENNKHAFALTTEVLNSSPRRIESDCSVFPACGGCAYRHISYTDEIQLKRDLLSEMNQLAEILERLNPAIEIASPDHSRNHIQLQFDGESRGFFQIHSNRVIPLPPSGCRQVNDTLNESMKSYPLKKRGKYPFRLNNEKVITPDDIGKGVILKEYISDTANTFWSFPSDGFFQTNRFLIHPWLSFISEQTRRINGGKTDRKALELFCGSGIIGGSIAPLFSEYTGMESDSRSLKLARINFKEHNVSGKFSRMDLYNKVPDMSGVGTVIVDPPRAGLNRPVQTSLARNESVKNIIYSSCNPHTLNRDIKALSDQGSFQATSAKIFDFFPRTAHLEMVVVLER